ncbi:enoyl-CoA hydratase-related protein [uncultured Xylophilus sp.]|uniref:enoyl-CoA hydratase-related protein n=1 Tax=uncultured Xylophilus sp. TaxID=296832 RepID=UPI0025F23B1E|nr:enoyl-CoA hydratase-related protein [uncultured Xylophilus sp.]
MSQACSPPVPGDAATDLPPVLHDLQDGVLVLTLNRPDRHNALSPAMYDDLLAVLESVATDPAVGAVVLTGAGGAFCAGGDVQRMDRAAAATPLNFEQKVARLRHRTRIVELLHTMDKPTIAMVRGAAVGAGLSLALACDLRYGDATVRMRTGFLQIASAGDFGGHYFLPRIVGPARARRLYLTSPMLDAPACADLGLLDLLCDDASQLEAETLAVARAWADGPRTALAYLKRNLLQGEGPAPLADVLAAEAWRHVRCTETDDHREAVRAYAERRPARFGASRAPESLANPNPETPLP